MKIKNILTMGLLAIALASPAAMAEKSQFSSEQKQAIEKVVHNYIVKNPEVLVEASQALQQKQQKNMQEQAKSAIKKNADEIFQGKMTVVGDPKGDVTLVEFFDYQCSHCKKMAPVINNILEKNKKLRVVYKEFPIFGESSELASRAALAAAMQGKYKAMHNALLKVDKRLNKELIEKTAESVGLNMKQLKKDMQSEMVTQALQENRQLAEKLRLMGTPAFIISPTPSGKYKKGADASFIPGAASEQSVQKLIDKAAGK